MVRHSVKIVIFTRTGFHHTSFINRLQERFEIACVVRESYPETRKRNVANVISGALFRGDGIHGVRNELFLKKFSEKYSAGFRFHPSLRKYLRAPFDAVIEKPGTKYINVGCGEINSEGFASFLNSIRPDIIAVMGSSVIRPQIIAIPSVAIINLHSGLSPYYRGTWSYGWPIVNDDPGYVGATVHHVNAGIDTGDIIFQTRPVFDPSDDLNAIFLKVITEGIELVADAVQGIGGLYGVTAYKQPRIAGGLYRAKDLTSSAARRCLQNLEGGAIARYNANKREIDSHITLYGYVPPKIFT
jgi:Formyl transferase